MSKRSLTITLETVTPLFLGGADPRGKPELRSASFRGILRFWLRALLGGATGYQHLERLRAAEADVFGSTGGASPVVLRLKGQPRVGIPNLGRDGLSYLFFALRGRGHSQPAREAFLSGQRFQLILQSRPVRDATRRDDHLQALQRAAVALWLLTHLGGLGARARRGGGALQVTRVDDDARLEGLPDWPVLADNPGEVQVQLVEDINNCRRLLDLTWADELGTAAFDVLHPEAVSIYVTDQTWSTWEAALDDLGVRLRDFRNRRSPDYERVKEAAQHGGDFDEIRRAAFGLPIVFYYRSMRGGGVLEGARHSRRASPLWFRVVRLRNGRYTLLIIVFRTALLPEGEKLKLRRRRGRDAYGAVPDYKIIDIFLRELGNPAPGNEHYLAPLLEVKGA